MSLELLPDENLTDGIRRMASEEAGAALANLDGIGDDPVEAIHDTRKRCKKIRAVLRLVRADLGEKAFQRENRAYRDAARRISAVRDAQVAAETLEGLEEHFDGVLREDVFRALGSFLAERQREVVDRLVHREGAAEAAREDLAAARERIEEWPLSGDGFDALRGGVLRTYERGRDALSAAYAAGGGRKAVERFHEWRKRVKYLWHQAQILRPQWPDLMEPYADALHQLSDYLGDDHDLAGLGELVAAHPGVLFGETSGEAEEEALYALLAQRQRELRAGAHGLGLRLFADQPKAFVRRWEGWWEAWRE